MKLKKIALLLFFSFAKMQPISMVWNFRIAQITKQPIFETDHEQRKYSLITLIFDQWRKKHNCTAQNYIGGLGAFIYNFWQHYYFRTDCAVSKIKEFNANDIEVFSGTEADDVLFTLGRNFIINDRSLITLSGLFGFPTHRILRLLHADFGYSQIGTGLQLDGSYQWNKITSFLYGVRYIYFIPRSAQDPACLHHQFTIGNIADLLFAIKNNWNQHGLEFGYTARWRFGAHSPSFDQIVKKTNYERSNLYLVYKYKFLTGDVAHRLLFNIAYGFDHKPKFFGNKYIVTLWTSWNIRFS